MAEAAKATKTYYLGTGRRKTAVARVRLAEGNGLLEINGRGLEAYFTEDKDRAAVLGPLDLLEMRNRLDVRINVRGGGGQLLIRIRHIRILRHACNKRKTSADILAG